MFLSTVWCLSSVNLQKRKYTSQTQHFYKANLIRHRWTHLFSFCSKFKLTQTFSERDNSNRSFCQQKGIQRKQGGCWPCKPSSLSPESIWLLKCSTDKSTGCSLQLKAKTSSSTFLIVLGFQVAGSWFLSKLLFVLVF